MHNSTHFSAIRPLLARLLGALLLALMLGGPVFATTLPSAGRPLAEALNPDGTLKPGANGSFDARQFRMGTAPDGRPTFRLAGTAGAGDEHWANGFNLPNGASGVVRVVVRSGNDIYIGGDFTAVGNVAANHVAKWNGTAWSSLGAGTGTGTGAANGVDGGVHALAVASNGDVYVGGDLMSAGGILASRVARWNGTVWRSLGPGPSNGVNNSVSALAISSAGDVYIGGEFMWAGGPANMTNYVVKWNGANLSSLGTGLNSTVSGLGTGPLGQLYAGGNFTATSDYTKVMAHFAIYDPNAALATTAVTHATPAVLFPNPARHMATLRLPTGMAPAPLVLTDAQGRAVRRYPAPAGAEAALDLRGLPAGLYLLHGAGPAQRLVVE